MKVKGVAPGSNVVLLFTHFLLLLSLTMKYYKTKPRESPDQLYLLMINCIPSANAPALFNTLYCTNQFSAARLLVRGSEYDTVVCVSEI